MVMPDMPRVLVVDDDPDISLALADYLRQGNFDVDVADTGNAALEKGLAEHYDAILLDVGLPDRNGIEILGELARQKPALPIILLTAFTSLDKSTPPDILNKAFAYLTKPYSREEIRQVLRRAVFGATALKKQGEPASAVSTNPPPFPSIIQPHPTSRPKTTGPSYQLSLDEYQRLTENIQLMQCAFDHVPDPVLVAGPDKRFCFANKAACDSLGYTREELMALRIPDVAPQHDTARFRQHLETLKQGQPLTYQSIHRTKDGREFPIEISVNLINFHGQEFTCAITRTLSPLDHPSDTTYGEPPIILEIARRTQP